MPETSIISEHTTSQSTMSRSQSSESSKASSHSESSQSLHASHCVAHSTHSWPKRAHVIEYHTIRLEIFAKNQGIGCVQIFFDCKLIVDLVILSEIIIIKSIVLLAHLFSDIYYSGETQMHRDQMFGFATKNTLSCKDMIFGMLYQNKVKVIVYQYLIMLIKLSLKYRSFLPLCYSTNALRFSTINQKKTELQRMRNRDYKSQRTKLIEAYNQQLKKERQKFSKRMLDLKINKSTQNFLNEFYQEKHDQFSVQAQNYKDKITFLSSKLKSDLTQIDQEEKTNTVKIYLTDHIKDQESTSSFVSNNENYQTGGFYIPNRFILKKMYLCNQKLAKNAKPGQQLLLAGVQSEQDHCLFLNKLFKEFNIKNVVTMVPPDLPFFLKTEDSFAEQWRKLLEDGNYAKKVKFYVNPKPKTLDQIVLHSHYSPYVRASLGRSSAFLDTHYYLMQQNQLSGNYEPLPLMTGLCNQNVQKNYIADFPVFQQRKMLANSISLQKLRQLFQLHLKNIRENKLNFSAQWLFPKEVLKKKLSHLLKVARAVTQVGDGRTILICPAQIAQLLSIQWQIGNKQNKLRFNYQDGKHYLDFGQQEEKEGEQTFIQFVQKLVILDVIMDQPVISKYFVKYKSFPFLCHHTIGGRENIGKIFIIWMHFYKTYYEALTEKRLLVGKDAQRRAQYFSKFQNPQDFH